jgi:hypothetical protein
LRGLKNLPKVKPAAMHEDALLELANRGDIVIDHVLGSEARPLSWAGPTLSSTGRSAGYETGTGDLAVLVETSDTFEAIAAHRSKDAARV